MLLARFQFRSPISWKFNVGDRYLFPLPEAKQWALLSPLLYSQLPASSPEIHCDQIAPGKYFIMTHEVVLGTEDDQIIAEFKQSEAHGTIPLKLPETIEKALVRLRHAGGQATIPNFSSLFMCTLTELDTLPTHDSSAIPQSRHSMVQEYWWRTALTPEHIGATTSSSVNFSPPTHEVLFLDAVAAHREGDFRKTILYAAMSMEVVFGSVIDKTYENIIAAPQDQRFRVIERALAGGSSVVKDPVYERLRRCDFSVLINELTLYTLARSLLVENESLYQQAKRLYSTRNKLAHSGVLDENESNETYALDNDGSMAALETASNLFAWLGERSDFPLPKSSFVTIRNEVTSP